MDCVSLVFPFARRLRTVVLWTMQILWRVGGLPAHHPSGDVFPHVVTDEACSVGDPPSICARESPTLLLRPHRPTKGMIVREHGLRPHNRLHTATGRSHKTDHTPSLPLASPSPSPNTYRLTCYSHPTLTNLTMAQGNDGKPTG